MSGDKLMQHSSVTISNLKNASKKQKKNCILVLNKKENIDDINYGVKQ